jgi:hypothetical protein
LRRGEERRGEERRGEERRGVEWSGVEWSAYKIIIGKPKGEKPLERRRCRRMDNIKIDLTEI